ncbi:DUF268 domain-containing protein [Cyanobium sp. HWJ4-Hawea]|uniref:DUF268 domain-containing protein n=1 Tax=Cyanobium sp. HWJ4-Hawea TaxID=2823713 RepID=UPI0020CC67A9|nr:DUF268 domain-containing protein [Cyanobium sp. HWJ4-Hawea]MCP9808482.1 DUF268 domain-containing protein [Cyanobium sp. HWJ4-Hawea]
MSNVQLSLITVAKHADNDLIKTIDSIVSSFGQYLYEVSLVLVIPADELLHFTKKTWHVDALKPFLNHCNIIHDKKMGIYSAFNYGIGYSKFIGSTHIAFINSGDELTSGFIDMLHYLRNNAFNVVSGVVSQISEDSSLIGQYSGGLAVWNVPHPATIYPIGFFLCLYSSKLRISADWHLHFLNRNNFAFIKLDMVVAKFYFGGISNSPNAAQILFKDEINACIIDFNEKRYLSILHPWRILRYFRITLNFFSYRLTKMSFFVSSRLKNFLKRIYVVLDLSGINLLRLAHAPLGLLLYMSDFVQYILAFLPLSSPSTCDLPSLDIFPCITDRFANAGSYSIAYLKMNSWALNQVKVISPPILFDVGSDLSGFVVPSSYFVNHVISSDIRNFSLPIDNISSIQLDLLNISSFKMSSNKPTYDLVSCLHVIEHIGLGRYGDSICPNGWKTAIKSLTSFVSVNGYLLIAVPIGSPRLYFNAHRVFDYISINNYVQSFGFKLSDFAYLDDSHCLHSCEIERLPESLDHLYYGLGLYLFQNQSSGHLE